MNYNSFPDSRNFQDSQAIEGQLFRNGASWYQESQPPNQSFSQEVLSKMPLANRPRRTDSRNFSNLLDDSLRQSFPTKPVTTSFKNCQLFHEFSLGDKSAQASIKNEGSSIQTNEVLFRAIDSDQQKSWRGLRLLSLKVKKIIQDDVDTSYKKVAQKLVNEMKISNKITNVHKLVYPLNNIDLVREEQNVKRRVYDALNVLIAADVIIKKGKSLKATESTRLFGKCSSKKQWEIYTQKEEQLRIARSQFLLKENFGLELKARKAAIEWLITRNKCQEYQKFKYLLKKDKMKNSPSLIFQLQYLNIILNKKKKKYHDKQIYSQSYK